MKQTRKIEKKPISAPISKADLEYHAGLMASIQDAVISTDERFVIKSWNKGAEKMYGFTAPEVIGKVLNEILATDYSTMPMGKLVEDFENNGHFRAEVIQTTKAGKKIHVLASSSALYDKAHKLTGAVIVYKDITERKKNGRAAQRPE